jgi:molybdopterin-guanine dinucleotide biosynthesis protein A
LQAGKRRVDAWFAQVDICYLDSAAYQPYDPDGLAFMNINTLEELKQAEQIARDSSAHDDPGRI